MAASDDRRSDDGDGTIEQRQRQQGQILDVLQRRILALVGGNPDMLPGELSKLFTDAGYDMRWLHDMHSKQELLERCIAICLYLETVDYKKALEFVSRAQINAESRTKRAGNVFWAIVSGALAAIVAGLAVVMLTGKHP